MREMRHVPAHRLIELGLPEGVVQMVVAPDHMGDAHIVIVHHHRQHVGRRTIAAQQHEIIQLFVGDRHLALHHILNDRLAGLRRLQPDHRRHARRRIGIRAVAPAPVIAHRTAFRLGLLAHRCQLFRRGIAAIGLALRQQLVRHLGMATGAGELHDGFVIPVEAQPFQPVEDRLHRILCGARTVGILDAQQEFAAGVPRIKPVKQRRAAAANMQEAGGRGSKTGDDGHGGSVPMPDGGART